MTPLTMVLVFAGTFALYALQPFLHPGFKNKKILMDTRGLEDLILRKEEVLSALSDLEYDFHMKKMTEGDYLQQKEKLIQQAVEIMKRLEGPNRIPQKQASAAKAKKHGLEKLSA